MMKQKKINQWSNEQEKTSYHPNKILFNEKTNDHTNNKISNIIHNDQFAYRNIHSLIIQTLHFISQHQWSDKQLTIYTETITFNDTLNNTYLLILQMINYQWSLKQLIVINHPNNRMPMISQTIYRQWSPKQKTTNDTQRIDRQWSLKQ